MKLLVDILMFILMLLEYSKGFINPLFHEIFGILLIILVVIHLILNKNYIFNISKGKYTISRSIMLIINAGFFISFILSIIFGILSSEELLKIFNIGSIKIINLHKIFAYVSLIFMGLHLGINFNTIFKKIKINKTIFYITEILISIYGIYSFIKLDIIKHLIGVYGFSLVEGSLIINILRYLSITLLIAILTSDINKLIIRRKKNER